MSAISPLDGRYKKVVSELSGFFSEQALMKARLEVEVKYLVCSVYFLLFFHANFRYFCDLAKFSKSQSQ